MSPFSCVLIGNESLLVQCGEILRERRHVIRAVVTRNPEIRAWAEVNGLPAEAPGPDLAARLEPGFDWLSASPIWH